MRRHSTGCLSGYAILRQWSNTPWLALFEVRKDDREPII